jgi:lysophospholipase
MPFQPPPFVSTPANPAPPGATLETVTTPDRRALRAAVFPATVPLRLGTVCVFPGRAESIEKYFETIAHLTKRGFAVAALDWRGQGGSQRVAGGRAGHVGAFAEYERDLDAFLDQVVAPRCPKPWFALAHSMGGLILFRAARREATPFARLVLSAPLFGLGTLYPPQGVVALAGAVLAPVFGRLSPNPFDKRAIDEYPFVCNVLTSDPARYTRNADIVRANPVLGTAGPTIGWVAAATSAMAEVTDERFAARVATPTLIVAAGDDRIVSNVAITEVASRLRGRHLLVLDGARHEIMMEQDAHRLPFLAAFDAFVPGEA